jgi:hypothetical protein
MNDEKDALLLTPLSRFSILLRLRRASLFAMPTISSSRQCQTRSICASILTNFSKGVVWSREREAVFCGRARAAFALCKAHLLLHKDDKTAIVGIKQGNE